LWAEVEKNMKWLREHRSSIPAAVALGAVLLFWLIGALGGLGLLHEAQSPMAMLAGLYLMLVLLAVSIVIAALSVLDLSRRAAARRRTGGPDPARPS
jgi:uncharacterized membrane protein